MTKYSLMETRSITLEDDVEINLKYYLINEERYEGTTENGEEFGTVTSDGEIKIYGIKLVKEGTDDVLEEDEVIGISDSEDIVKDLIRTLADHTITPVVLGEVVDDWATEKLFA